jgi:hypothetical protein
MFVVGHGLEPKAQSPGERIHNRISCPSGKSWVQNGCKTRISSAEFDGCEREGNWIGKT